MLLDLRKTLDIRLTDSHVNEGRLTEIARGLEKAEEILRKVDGVTAHVFFPGQIGGNHYHHIKKEIFGVAYGSITVCLYDPSQKKTFHQPVNAGQAFTLVPEVAHALYNHTQNLAFLVEISNSRFSENYRDDQVQVEDNIVQMCGIKI